MGQESKWPVLRGVKDAYLKMSGLADLRQKGTFKKVVG